MILWLGSSPRGRVSTAEFCSALQLAESWRSWGSWRTLQTYHGISWFSRPSKPGCEQGEVRVQLKSLKRSCFKPWASAASRIEQLICNVHQVSDHIRPPNWGEQEMRELQKMHESVTETGIPPYTLTMCVEELRCVYVSLNDSRMIPDCKHSLSITWKGLEISHFISGPHWRSCVALCNLLPEQCRTGYTTKSGDWYQALTLFHANFVTSYETSTIKWDACGWI